MVEKQLNYRLVLGLVLGVLVFGTAVYFAHGYQARRHAQTLHDQAVEAEKAGQLDKTATFLQRYLIFRPGDTSTLAHYGDVLESQAKTTSARWRVVTVFEQVLDREPGREDLRRRVVALLLELDDYDDATRHLEILLAARPEDGELENLLAQCQEAQGDYDKAAASYEMAIAHAPDRVAAHAHLAGLLRYRLDNPRRADQVIDKLVRTNPKSADAWLERGLYRLGNGLVEPASLDLEQARALAPDDPRILIVSAEVYQQLGESDKARDFWTRGLQKHPRDTTMFIGLATQEMQTDRPAEAVACVKKGLEIYPDHPDLLHLLIEAYLQQQQPDKAKEVVARIDPEKAPPGLSDYLAGRVLQSTGRWDEAIQSLDRAAREPEATNALASRAWLALGNCYERLGDSDRQVSAYQRAIGLEPSLLPAHYGLGSAFLAVGKVEEALEQYRQISQLPRPPETIWVLLARTLLQRNLSLPPNKRNWDEISRALDRADKVPSQTVPAALLRGDILVARDDLNKARAVLEDARTRHADQVALWTALATLDARQGDLAGAEKVLADARKQLGDRPELLLNELQLRAGQEGPEVERFLHGVEKNSVNYAPETQAGVLAQVAEAYYRLGQPRDGDRVCRLLAERKPLTLQRAITLLDLVLQGGDEPLQESVIAELRALEGDAGTWWRYGEAARCVLRARRGDRSGVGAARTLLAEMEKQRPTWARVALLGALLDDLADEPSRALDGYLRAFEQGERQPVMVRRLVQRLVEAGRIPDADQVVRKLQQEVVLRGDFARLAAEVALRNRQTERAATLARQAFAPDSRDYHSYLWLGQMLAACGQPDEAETVFRQAVALAEDVPDAWVALVAHLANADRIPAAEAVVAAMRTKVAPDRLEVAIGICYETLGRWDLAEQHYKAARREQPRDDLAMRRLAGFYLRLDHADQAEPVLRELIDPANPVPGEGVAWARRQLAMILALKGDESSYREALDLLDHKGNASRAERRALDLVHATRGDARRAGLRALEESMAAYPLAVEEELFVARLYNLDDDWPKARDHLQKVTRLDPKNPEYLALCVHLLLVRGKKDEARSWVDKLERLEPDSARVKKFRVELGQASETDTQ